MKFFLGCLNFIVSLYLIGRKRSQSLLIGYWASIVNALNLDFNKSPFSISAGFKLDLKPLEAYLKGEFKRI